MLRLRYRGQIVMPFPTFLTQMTKTGETEKYSQLSAIMIKIMCENVKFYVHFS
jgi:hypothetical protein